MNNVVLIGRLTRDVDLRETQSGLSYARFSLAVDKRLSKEKKREMESRGEYTADFINIVVWGQQAEHCAKYLAKGRLCAVQGRLQSGSYEKDGIKHYTTDVVANNVEFLEWGDRTNSDSSSNSKSDDFGDISGFEPTDDDIPF